MIEPLDVVVDAACGWGEGSNMLASVAVKVHAFDYREDCIDYARRTYPHAYYSEENLNTTKKLPSCDVGVSIETIEHLDDPQRFANLLKTAARKKIFVSTPIVPTKHTNKDHKHDFTPDDVIRLFKDDKWSISSWATQGNVYGIFLFTRV
jgi:2-polyprenyl-3-methyl-5-hydroxy-6-metoxy-1,4-benzoquinol methylase